MLRFKKGIRFEVLPSAFVDLSFLPALGLILVLMVSPAMAEESPPRENWQRFEQIKIRIAELEIAQKNLLDQQDEILEKTAGLKILSRHSGHRTSH